MPNYKKLKQQIDDYLNARNFNGAIVSLLRKASHYLIEACTSEQQQSLTHLIQAMDLSTLGVEELALIEQVVKALKIEITLPRPIAQATSGLEQENFQVGGPDSGKFGNNFTASSSATNRFTHSNSARTLLSPAKPSSKSASGSRDNQNDQFAKSYKKFPSQSPAKENEVRRSARNLLEIRHREDRHNFNKMLQGVEGIWQEALPNLTTFRNYPALFAIRFSLLRQQFLRGCAMPDANNNFYMNELFDALEVSLQEIIAKKDLFFDIAIEFELVWQKHKQQLIERYCGCSIPLSTKVNKKFPCYRDMNSVLGTIGCEQEQLLADLRDNSLKTFEQNYFKKIATDCVLKLASNFDFQELKKLWEAFIGKLIKTYQDQQVLEKPNADHLAWDAAIEHVYSLYDYSVNESLLLAHVSNDKSPIADEDDEAIFNFVFPSIR